MPPTTPSPERGGQAEERGQASVVRVPAEAGEMFGLLAERSDVLLWCTDAKGRCTWVSPRWPKLTGLQAEAFLGMGWVRAVHPEDVAIVRSAFKRALALRGATRLEFRARDAAGWRYVAVQAVPRVDDHGTLRGFVAVAHDVDARRRLERALRSAVEIRVGRSETETLHSLARGLADVLGIRFAAFAQLEEREGARWARLVAGSLDGAEVEEFAYRLDGSPCALVVHEEFCRIDRDAAERFPADAALRALKIEGYAGLRLDDSEGVPLGIAILADDQVFDGKSELYSTLKLFGARAAAELERGRTEASLRTARTRAEASSAAKGEFLASMSHEIRTPLNGVLGMTQLLLDTDLSDVQREYIGTIESSGNALLGVINDILDFSKIEAGKLSVESILIDPWALAEDVTVLLAEQARRGGNRFGTFIRPDVPRHLLSDPTRVRQVLLNFCSNALKFTEHGEVYLHAEVVPGERPLLRFEVRDTGCGIAPEVQAHLFDAFSQADETITRRFGGTGLGLAISKRLVKLMGGEIGVRSEVGVGSTFWF
ncbi:MAG: PAS domain S-box protein, partial [Planctomycetes bacterium]|nr:PAS domain S-box protein [Planctomycetota bacterium]